MNTPSLGEARFPSHAGRHSISDDVRIPEHIEAGTDPGLQFELAGPPREAFLRWEEHARGHCYMRRFMPGAK
jgi:hypothetical protein